MFDLNSVLKKINSWIKAVFGKEFNRLLGSSEEYFEAEESSYENDIISRTQEEIKELNQKEILRREQEKKENQQVNVLKAAQVELDIANALSNDIESVEATTAKDDAITAAEDALAAVSDMEDDIEPVEGTTAKADAITLAKAALNTLQNENIFDIEECSDGVATVSGYCIVDEGLN